MVRLIVIFLSAILIFGWGGEAIAANEPLQITQEQLQKWENLSNQALNAVSEGDFATSEKYWTQILTEFPQNPAVWSNRGNVRVSQNNLQGALEDYNKAIELAPNVADPYLNRGVAFEGLGKWSNAIADYNRVLELDPNDAMAYNNRGNAQAGLRKWSNAIADYQKAAEINPKFAFARANHALAEYEIGHTEAAIREMKGLARKYPQFADIRAALTAAYWADKRLGEAESNWVAAYGLDNRYKDIDWVKNVRRWPPSLVVALDKFLKIQ